MSTAADLVEPISDEDIEWISKILHLQPLDEPRRLFLTSIDSMDVSACPGSGKTTLVVAKLAILARKWKSRTQGICVLSHTNVARKEIEERLVGTEMGHLLLGYPHYIDTIHGFVNRFLAIPWLLSHGHAVTAVDNDITAAKRRRIIRGSDLYRLRAFLERKNKSVEGLRLRTVNFADPLGDDPGFQAGRHTTTYQIAARALSGAAQQGYFCHDEMLMFGEELLREHPEVASILARRFPFVLFDEMQDTSARQGKIIASALPPSRLVSIQRVGDSNQAIFEDEDAADSSLPFPDPARCLVDLPNSFRFDDSIASHANRLAVEPVGPVGLQGARIPSPSEPTDRHRIFVFPDDDTSQVIPTFAAHVAAVMDGAQAEEGSVIAIGEVHRVKEEIQAGDAKFPATVCHYWDGYHPNAASKTARPENLVGYIRVARALMTDGRTAEAVDLIASGVAGMANMLSETPVVRPGSRPHRALERQLANSQSGLAAYRSMLLDAAPGGEDSKAQWERLTYTARRVVAALLDVASVEIENEFLNWVPAIVDDSHKASEFPPGPNIYRVTVGERTIDVRMSSIHAVKGETHFASLIVETFYQNHALESLFPWLLGERQASPAPGGGKSASVRELRRLRMNYVALTRSTHVVCLAIPSKSLGTAVERAACSSRLEAQGWRITEVPAVSKQLSILRSGHRDRHQPGHRLAGWMFVVDARTKLTPYRPSDRPASTALTRSATRTHDPESPHLLSTGLANLPEKLERPGVETGFCAAGGTG
jgi:DNA helicase II / ATP-dependent DNA helicase PcrA